MIVHNSLSSFLEELKLPETKLESFYIVQYEEYNSDVNYSEYIYSHKFFEISLVTGYNAEVSVGTTKRNVSEHNLIFVSPNQEVSWNTNKKYLNAKSYLLLFSPEILNNKYNNYSLFSSYPFFNRYTNSIFKVSETQIQFLVAQFEILEKEYRHLDGDSTTIFSSYLSIILIYLKRELKFDKNLFVQKSRSNEIAYRFEQQVIFESVPKKTIKYYANTLHISPVYLAECIKKATNRTFKNIVDEYTVLKAKSLLKNEDVTIQYVADSLGFEERSSFTKYFKKHTNLTPKQFQRT